MPNVILTATVTHISPTATISSGVVNYNVRVAVQPPSSPFGQFGSMTGPTGNVTMPPFSSNFTPPEGFPPPGDFELPEGFEFPDFSGFQMPDQTDYQLREGLTVTVTITVATRTNVLLVPNGALFTEEFKSFVQVVKKNGELEKREVTPGINNWQFTEITEGLEEGEQVVVTLNLAPDFGDFGGGMMFMGGGR
jgi:hypothetical protein